MGVWSCGRKKDMDCQLQKRALHHDPLPQHIASLPLHTARQMVNVQQAQCFVSTSNLLQMGRSSIACMLSTSAHSPLPAPVWGPVRKVSTHMENLSQSIPATSLPVLFPKHCSDQAARTHVVKLFYYCQSIPCCHLPKGTLPTLGEPIAWAPWEKEGSAPQLNRFTCFAVCSSTSSKVGRALVNCSGACKRSVRDWSWQVRSVTWTLVQLVSVWVTHPSGAGCSAFGAADCTCPLTCFTDLSQ